jgi:hypothetical protein
MKVLLIAALVTAAIPAMASKARLDSLSAGAYTADAPANGPAHLLDTQTIFNNPAHNILLGEYVTFEMGTQTTTSTISGAEGGFAKKHGDDAMYAFYLGRKSKFTTTMRQAGGFQGQENPIEIQYAKKGDGMDWGLGLSYSASDNKSGTPDRKQNTLGGRFGIMKDGWDAHLLLGLGSSATGHNAVAASTTNIFGGNSASADGKYTGTTGVKVGVKKKNEDGCTWYLESFMDGMKYDNSANATYDGAKAETSNTRLGYIHETKVDMGNFFLGAEYQINTDKASRPGVELKSEFSKLPIFAGIEIEPASWMILRGSVRQNFVLGSSKTTLNGTGEADTIANNSEVAAGIGWKFGKTVIDASLAAQTTGNIEPSTAGGFMTNAALTHTF